MKKALFFILVSMSISFGVNAQEYIPMLSEGKSWTCINGYYQNSPSTNANAEYNIIVEGDTIVEGKKMTKIVWKYRDGHTHSYAAYEENGKLYSYFQRYDDEKETLMLMYDMNWNVGDKTLQGKVTAVDEIEVKGIKRKRITVGEGEYSTYIVEGIGADWLWFFGGVAPDNSSDKYMFCQYMTECYDNGSLIFTQTDFMANPTTSVNTITTNLNEHQQTMYDISGKRINMPSHGSVYIQNGKKRVR